MTTLYATDLDGTLLGADAKLSEQGARLWRELADAGALVSFITARTPATIEPILQPAAPRIPGVAMTGAAIWTPSTRIYESVEYHRPADVLAIAEICRRAGVAPFLYTMPQGGIVITVYHEAEALSPVERAFVEQRTLNDLKSFRLRTPFPAGAERCAILFFAMGDPAVLRRAADEIRAATGCYASCYPDTYNPGLGLLEVFAPGVSKAAGMAKLRAMLGAERVVAFGDNLNDLPMLQAADLAVVVGNAHPDVKAAADIVIGPNTADSVLRWIAQDFQS